MTLSLAMTVRLLGLVAVALTLSPTHLLAHSQTCSETVVSTQVDCSNFANHRGRLTLVNGIQLVDQFGETVQLRGISSHGLQYFPNCVTKDSIEYLVTTWGINVFRAVVYVDAVDNGYEVNADYFDNFIINIVQWCKELGIYVIIDWHVLLSGDPNAHLDSRGADTGLAVDFWTKYATLYKDETHVLYEIANEPNNIDWPTVLDYHNSIIGVIRAIDSEAIIIAGTTKWCQEINLAYENPVDEPYNVMYAFHFYASEHSNLLPLFEQYMHLMPLFVSEWRISDSTGSGTYSPDVAEQFLDKFAGLDDSVPPRRVVSWVQWSIADKADTASLLQPGACDTESWALTSCQGKFTENYLKDREYELSVLDCDRAPTASPTISPRPTSSPSAQPSNVPTGAPSHMPSAVPSTSPSTMPSISQLPTGQPSYQPSAEPSIHIVSSSSGVDTEDIIGPSGAYLISFLGLIIIAAAVFLLFRHFSSRSNKEGEFHLASTTFEANGSHRQGGSSYSKGYCNDGDYDGGQNYDEESYSGGGEVELGMVDPQYADSSNIDNVTSIENIARSNVVATPANNASNDDGDDDNVDFGNIYGGNINEGSYFEPPKDETDSLVGSFSLSRSPMVPPSSQNKPVLHAEEVKSSPPYHSSEHTSPNPGVEENSTNKLAETSSTPYPNAQKRRSPVPRQLSGRTSPKKGATGVPPPYLVEHQVSSRSRFEKKQPKRNTRTIK